MSSNSVSNGGPVAGRAIRSLPRTIPRGLANLIAALACWPDRPSTARPQRGQWTGVLQIAAPHTRVTEDRGGPADGPSV